MRVSTGQNKHTAILHSLYLSGKLSEEDTIDYLSSFYGNTYKAYGFIKVSDKDLAFYVLKQHFKDIDEEYTIEYYPTKRNTKEEYGFIQDSNCFFGGLHLANFDLNIPAYLVKLYQAGVIIEEFFIDKED